MIAMILTAACLCGQPADDYATAYYASQRTGRPLIVLVGAAWCGPCQAFRREHPELAADLRRRGEYAYADADRDRGIVQRIGVKSIPALAIMHYDQARREWTRRIIHGAAEIVEFAREGEK